jgi:hypothetical protein
VIRAVVAHCRGFRGYGVFDCPIILTAEDASNPSTWKAPAWLDPTRGGVGMTYHPYRRWLGDRRVSAAARGQEFIADIGERMDAAVWLRGLFGEN